MTSEVTKRTGPRLAVPKDAHKSCASCGEPRGNRKQGWEPIYRNDKVLGYTCPECPAWSEPIRRIAGARGVRFIAVVDATPPGATKRQQTKRSHKTLAEARKWVTEVRTEVAETGGIASLVVTVAKALDDWLNSRTKLRPPTRRNYMAQYKPVIDAFGDKPVKELQASHVEQLIASMQAGGKRDGKPFGAWAIHAAVGRLSQALDRCVRDGIVGRNVTLGVELPDIPKNDDDSPLYRWDTEGEGKDAWVPNIAKFRAAADQHRDAGAWRLTLCGLTRADIMGLRWSDIDLDKGEASVRQGRVILDGKASYTGDPKSEQRIRPVRFERLEPGTVALMRRMKAQQAKDKLAAGAAYVDSGYLVVNELGEPLRPELYSDRFRSLCRKAGVPVIKLHNVRHTLALLMRRRGVKEEAAAAFLGHTEKVYKGTYALSEEEDKKDQASLIDIATAALAPRRRVV